MTIEELLELSADDIEKFSAAELEKILLPYFDVTRPERQQKKASSVRSTTGGAANKVRHAKAKKHMLTLEVAKALAAGNIDKAKFLQSK